MCAHTEAAGPMAPGPCRDLQWGDAAETRGSRGSLLGRPTQRKLGKLEEQKEAVRPYLGQLREGRGA